MKKAKILPEICYEYTPLSLEEIFKAYQNNDSVTGYVEQLLVDEQIVVVRLGVDILAHMPFSEATIYPIVSKKPIPANIACINRKKIRVKIRGISKYPVTVSRKDNMAEAFELLSSCELAKLHVTSTKKLTAFGDIGCGILAHVYSNEICRTHIQSAEEYFNPGDLVDVAIIRGHINYQFDVSYKRTFEPYNPEDYAIGMTVRGKVRDWFQGPNCPGFYVSLTPQVSGIMNARNTLPDIKYGTDVVCTVSGVGAKGLHLEFSRFA